MLNSLSPYCLYLLLNIPNIIPYLLFFALLVLLATPLAIFFSGTRTCTAIIKRSSLALTSCNSRLTSSLLLLLLFLAGAKVWDGFEAAGQGLAPAFLPRSSPPPRLAKQSRQ